MLPGRFCFVWYGNGQDGAYGYIGTVSWDPQADDTGLCGMGKGYGNAGLAGNIGNYKEKREKTLENLALKLAKSVEKTGKPIKLEPMQAYERKIIHSALQESKTVKTESIGEEPRRRIVISLKY